jgi:ribosomal protein S18 acetylase RimI-like enzyme
MNLMLNLHDPSRILRQFDAEMRADPPPEPGVSRTWSGGVLRSIGAYQCVGYSALSESEADQAIAAEVDFFRALGRTVEWKLYSHDQPADLAERLARAGFKPEETEHFMMRTLQADMADDRPPEGIAIRQVRDLAGLEDYVAAGGAAFERDESWVFKAYGNRLTDPTLVLHVAYDGSRPVAAGRLELPRGRAFASLWGGGIIPGHRGRGIYRALIATRAWEALWRGYRYITVDARDTSCPILRRLGFVELAQVTGWIREP